MKRFTTLASLCVAMGLSGTVPTLGAGQDEVTTGRRFVHVVQRGESLTSVGARAGVDVRGLARLNGLPPHAMLTTGQTLYVDSRHLLPSKKTGIIINIPQRMLFMFKDGRVDVAYPVGLGRRTWPTFVGTFAIERLEPNPTWDVPLSIQEEMRRAGEAVVTQVPPCPENPLGTFWIGLDRPGFGIHGTNAPASIYQFLTHGCIRLHPDDIDALSKRVMVGMTGEVLYEPVLLAVSTEGDILIEVHPDIYRRAGDPRDAAAKFAGLLGVTARIDWTRVDEAVRRRDGLVTEVTLLPE